MIAEIIPGPGAVPPHKPPPFGIRVPRSPAWPPYRWVKDPEGRPIKHPGHNFLEELGNWFASHFGSIFGDPQETVTMATLGNLADHVATRFRQMAIAVDEDIKSAYESNLKYEHAILQYVEAIGRAAEHSLKVQEKQINDLRKREEHDVKSLQHVITRDRATAKREAEKARAYAIHKSMANTRAYIAKHYEHKIAVTYDWLLNRDLWFKHAIDRWWAKTYKRQIAPVKQAANGWRIPFGSLWGHINAKIDPTVKLVAGARDWLKLLKHWEKRALEAFGVLKAGEVLAWLVKEHQKAPAK